MLATYISQHLGETLCQTFRNLADETWNTLLNSGLVRLTIGEETITDVNLLAIQALHPANVAVVKFSRAREAQTGADWEWWLGNPSDGWFGMRIQAKKITPRRLAYNGVDHPDGTCLQIKNLMAQARAGGYVAAYCLYNTDLPSRTDEWGCAIVSAHSMLAALNKSRKAKVVDFASVQSVAFPWHRLVCRERPDPPLPRVIRDRLAPIMPRGGQEDLEHAFRTELPTGVMNVIQPFITGNAALIETAGDVVENPETKYLVVTSDLPIFNAERGNSIIKEL